MSSVASRSALSAPSRARARTTLSVSAFALALALGGLASAPAGAQTLNDKLARGAAPSGNSKLLVEAKELVYDRDKNTVSASGDAQLYYSGRTLEADRVIYDRNSKRVFAEGNAKFTDENGNVYYSSRFELTDDFKDGFIESLKVEGKDKTYFTAPRAERTGGDVTVFERGTYTACAPCKDDPERPPLWQVRAGRIIHNNTERMVYYEDARLELYGYPIFYSPYLSAPDPSVTRKTGFLAPRYIAASGLGFGVSAPFFWNLAPNYDLLLTPTILSRQGFLGQVEWRQRLEHGSYNIRAAGIHQEDPNAFLPSPFGARDKDFRGSIESTGKFLINPRWTAGWDVAATTDKFFYQNYKVKSESVILDYNAYRESISQVYLTGHGDRSFFDARAYYIKGLSYFDWQKQIPVVHPVIDYDRRWDGPSFLGGEVRLQANLTSLSREQAAFQETGAKQTYLFNFPGGPGGATQLFDACAIYQPGACLVRGIAGSYTRATADLSWRRRFIDPLGQAWTPFASARVDAALLDLDTRGPFNQFQRPFIDDESTLLRGMPTLGIDYRYPFVATQAGWGTHTVEPIAQVIARPGENRVRRFPNEDAQSLVFDDTNIFATDKFSGYDRVEGGTRANLGGQYTFVGYGGAYANVLAGESFHIAGRNSFESGDLANTGRDSGLESRRSDYVGRIKVSPNGNFSLTARGRFDENSLAMRRLDVTAATTIGPVNLGAIYARYDAQPELGLDRRREGLLATAGVGFAQYWRLDGGITFDLDKAQEVRAVTATGAQVRSSPFGIGAYSIGAVYRDECTTFGVTYSSQARDPTTGLNNPTQTVLVRLELRTLGQANFSQSISAAVSGTDGLAN